MSKCKECLFIGVYQDMGASCNLCTRCGRGLVEAIAEYEKPQPCEWHITKQEVIALQKNGVIKPKLFNVATNTGDNTKLLKIEGLGTISESLNRCVNDMAKAIENAVKKMQ